MALISNNDLFCIERQGRSYKWTGAELNLQIQEISPIADITGNLPIEVDISDRIVTISIRDGTLDEKGAVKLTNTVNNSETLALTPKGAKTELDKKANNDGSGATGTWNINITGNANTATFAIDSQNSQRVYVKRDDDSNANRYLTFVDSSTAENKELSMDNGLSYNPLSNVLTTSVFKGSLNGRADRATQADNATNAVNATNATNVIVINDGSDTSRYLTFASMASGADKIRTDGGLRYNPFNNIFSTTNIELSGYFTSNSITTNTAVVNNSISTTSITATSIDLSGEIKARSANILTGISAASADLSGNLTSNNISTVNIVASEIAAKNVTLTSKIKAATAEITGNLSASGISARTGDFSGNLSAGNGTFSGNISAVNATISNKLNGKDASFNNNLTAKSASISAKLTAGTIQSSTGNITNTLTAGSVSMNSFNSTTGNVTNNLGVGSISGGTASFTGKLTAGSAQINGALNAQTASISGPLSASSAAISGGFSAASATIGGAISSGSISTGSLSVSVDANIGRNVNCSHIVTAETIQSTGDTFVGGNFIVRTGSDHKAVILNDGGAYFANEKIWLYNNGNVKFNAATTGSITTNGNISVTGNVSSSSLNTVTLTTSTISASGRITSASINTGTITSGAINASGTITAPYGSFTNSGVTTDLSVGRNINCGHIVTAVAINSTGDTRVGGNFIVQTGSDHKAVIYNDGGAYFANEKIWFHGSGDIECRNLNSKSDRRFKTDIQPVTDALTSLRKLNGVKFKWTDTDDKSMGVIAQDVEEVFPELVNEKEEFKSVNYNGLVGALIEAVKELSARVEELENTK